MKSMLKLIEIMVVMVFMTISATAFTGDIVDYIEVNDDNVYTRATGVIRSVGEFDKGEMLDIKVRVIAPDNESLKDIKIAAEFENEYDDRTYDSTSLFDLDKGNSDSKKLQVRIPTRTDEEILNLHFIITSKNNPTIAFDVPFHIKGKKNQVEITRMLFNPQNVVKAGAYIVGKVRIENLGYRDQDDVLIKAWVEGLEGAQDTDIVDEIEAERLDNSEEGESITSEELYLPIPLCAKEGSYKVKVEVSYDRDRSKQSSEFPIRVEPSNSDVCDSVAVAPSEVVTMSALAQTVNAGAEFVIPVTLTNSGRTAKAYVVSADATGFGQVRYDPSSVVTLQSGQTQTVLVYTKTNADAEGTKWLNLAVRSGNDVVKQATLPVTIAKSVPSTSSTVSVKKALEIIAIVLVVLIVLLILIIGFNRLRGNDDDEADSDKKTYY